MRFKTFCCSIFFIILATVSCCRKEGYRILETKESNSKARGSYVESTIVSAGTAHDTILHFRFSLDNDSFLFNQSPLLNLGVSFRKTTDSPALTFNVAYLAVTTDEKLNPFQYFKAGNVTSFKNYKSENGNKRFERAIGVLNNLQYNAIASTHFTNENDMKEFLRIFEHELTKTLNKDRRLIFTSAACIDLNATIIEMVVDYN